MKYCRCGPKFRINAAQKEPAPPGWQAAEVYRCADCGHISHAVQEAVAVVRGPADARAILHAVNHQSGQAIITWATSSGKLDTVNFYPWPRRVPMSETEPLIFKTWELLMSKVAVILREPTGPGDNAIEADERERAKYEGRGIAQVLAIQMKPFMTDADHVVKCAVKKYKNPDFEVPGLGEHLWDPTKNPDGSPRVPVAAPKSKPTARPKPVVNNKSTRVLKPEEAEGIREAVKSGMFSEEDVAAMFKVSLDTVKQAVSG